VVVAAGVAPPHPASTPMSIALASAPDKRCEMRRAITVER
jgi:hypothetical protein